MVVRSGKLRHRMTVKRDTSSAGADQPNYETHLENVPCNVVETKGMEKHRGKQLEATTTHAIEIRFTTAIRETDIIEYNGQTLNIESILNRMGRRRKLDIYCSSVE